MSTTEAVSLTNLRPRVRAERLRRLALGFPEPVAVAVRRRASELELLAAVADASV